MVAVVDDNMGVQMMQGVGSAGGAGGAGSAFVAGGAIDAGGAIGAGGGRITDGGVIGSMVAASLLVHDAFNKGMLLPITGMVQRPF